MNNNPFEKFAKEIMKEAHRKLSKRMKASRDERSRRRLIEQKKKRNEQIDQILPFTNKSVNRRKLLNQKRRNELLIQRLEAKRDKKGGLVNA